MAASQNYGVREIFNVTLREYKSEEPKAFIESLTASSLEISAQSASLRGGQGNPERIIWDSEKDIAMNMTDSLITKATLETLTGSKFSKGARIVPKKEVVTVTSEAGSLAIVLTKIPVASNSKYPIFFYKTNDGTNMGEKLTATSTGAEVTLTGNTDIKEGDEVIASYYYEAPVTTQSITISADIFPGVYALEGTTFWRNEDGEDVEALFLIPKLKILPNFTIGMASSGDPQPFEFNCKVLKDKNNEMVTIVLLEEDDE